ncbi:UPF0643 protein [Yarrowia sp. C11]|nr:UPF0643 protein [Yarrowia sp. E02]KAG5367664.1 UPF0643 protein [Yarrowia sp. C11]
MATIAIDSNPFQSLKTLSEPHYDSERPRIVQSSPYTGEAHLLDLGGVPQNLHEVVVALRDVFRAVKPDYAVGDYVESFPFEDLTPLIPEGVTLHCVAFRSRLFEHVRTSHDMRQKLSDLDEASHAEANTSGGLLKYWFGIPDEAGNNLATCVWISKKHADDATSYQRHNAAAKTVRGWYENWQVEIYEWSRAGLNRVR